MKRLTEIALERGDGRVFTRSEVDFWLGGSPDRQYGLIKRAIAAGEIVRVHRGLYLLARSYGHSEANPLAVAQRIHGPSYVSLETALAYHQWIPEAVHAVASVTLDRARKFDTPLGRFSFTRVPQQTLMVGVRRVQPTEGDAFLMASPLKALADYVYDKKCDWHSARPVVRSLRIDEQDLAGIESEEFDDLAENYSSRRVLRFLSGLREDLRR